MPLIDKAKVELVELAERLHAIAKMLQHVPPDHPASPGTIECLRKEIRAIAAQLKQNPLFLNNANRHQS